MPFPAPAAGLCDRCHRPFAAGDEITSTTSPTVVPSRYAHAGRCPLRPVRPIGPGTSRPRPLPDPDEPMYVRGILAGHEFEIAIRGLPVDMFRLDEDSLSILVTPAELCEQRPEPAPGARRTA